MPFSPNEIRQFTRELRERRAEAEALRRDLAASELETNGIEGLIRRLRELESGRTFNDPAEVARLQQSVVQGFKELEFALSRALGPNNGRWAHVRRLQRRPRGVPRARRQVLQGPRAESKAVNRC